MIHRLATRAVLEMGNDRSQVIVEPSPVSIAVKRSRSVPEQESGLGDPSGFDRTGLLQALRQRQKPVTYGIDVDTRDGDSVGEPSRPLSDIHYLAQT